MTGVQNVCPNGDPVLLGQCLKQLHFQLQHPDASAHYLQIGVHIVLL